MIVVDIETSGLDPARHGILSIGAVDYNNPENTFYEELRLEEGKEIDQVALKINGFTEENIRDPTKKPLNKVLHEFQLWVNEIKEITLAGQNPAFDASFLKQAFKEKGFPWGFGHRCIDLYTTAIITYLKNGFEIPQKSGRYVVGLEGILWSVGLPKRVGSHNGLADAKLEAEAFSRLIYSKNWSKEFSEFPVCLRNPPAQK